MLGKEVLQAVRVLLRQEAAMQVVKPLKEDNNLQVARKLYQEEAQSNGRYGQ